MQFSRDQYNEPQVHGLKCSTREFSGSPVVRTHQSHSRDWVPSLVGELLTQCTKKKKKRQARGKQLQQIVVFVAQNNTLYDPMDCSTSGFSVLHYLLEFAQTHVHWASDAIQPSHPLSPPSPPALSCLHESALHIRWPKDRSFSISPSSSRRVREKFLPTGDTDRVSPISSVSSRNWNGGRCKPTGSPFGVITVQRKTLPTFALLVLRS